MKAGLYKLLDDVQLKPRFHFVTVNRVTGEVSQHLTRTEATLAFGRIMTQIDCDAPHPAVFEWSGGHWKEL